MANEINTNDMPHEKPLPIIYGDIPENTIEMMVEEAENRPIYPKITPEGFDISGQIVDSLKGKIVAITPYWCRWENKKPEKIYSEKQPSEDFDRRCEMVLISFDNFELQLDLPSSSYTNLCQFVKHTQTMHRNVAEVPVMLTTHAVEGQYGLFTVVKFTVWAADDIPF